MAKPKGSKKVAGRVKGTPNKATTNAREAIAAFVEGNVERLTNWLDRIACDDPKDAFTCFMSVVEYHIPKLARQELTGKDGAAIAHEHKDLSAADAAIIAQYRQELLNQFKGKNHELQS